MSWFALLQPPQQLRRQAQDEHSLIVEGQMILGESFASLYFPPGVLPRGCLQIELQTLDFCTSNDPAHKHFAADTKVPYPMAAGNVYQNTITVTKEIPRPLVYAKRRSLFKANLADIAPPQ